VRPYTPTTPVRRRGSFQLVVKDYPEGKVSKALHGLREGDTLDVKGPMKKYEYVANQWDAVGLIAGGTGVTPMYQLITEILANPRDRTEVRLIYANRSEGDILLRDELDALAATHPNFKVLYTVDKAGPEWKGHTGHVSAAMLTSVLPPPQREAGRVKVMVCGPPGLMKHLSGEKKSPTDQGELTGLLKQLHYAPDQVFKY
jgi:cytochrome-b5 reductase